MKKIICISLMSIVCNIFLHAQTGVFVYKDSFEALPHAQIVDIIQTSNGDICFTGEIKDEAMETIYPLWGSVSSKGELKHLTKVSTNPIYFIANIIALSDGKTKIFGSIVSDGSLKPYVQKMDSDGSPSDYEMFFLSKPTMIGAAATIGDEVFVYGETQRGSDDKFNILIVYQTNPKEGAGNSELKKLSSEKNEEVRMIVPQADKTMLILGRQYNDDLSVSWPLVMKISSDGNVLWRKVIYLPHGMVGFGLTSNNNGIWLMGSYSESGTTSTITKLVKMNQEGDSLSTTDFMDIKANGITTLSNGNMMLYGSKYELAGMYLISKAAFKMIDNTLNVVKEDALGMFDKPDAELPSLAMTAMPTSSEILIAKQLNDKRIVCGGRVYIPTLTEPEEILSSPRSNNPMIILMKEDGTFRE